MTASLFLWLIPVGMAVLFLLALAAIVILLLLRRPKWQQDQQQSTEETRMIQTMHQQLSRMEDRVEALETILSDHGKGGQGR